MSSTYASDARIVADSLTYALPDGRTLFHDLSLAFGGDRTGLIGPNGSGKTTLVRCLTGTTTPTGGEATLLGTSPSAADRSRIGLLPQDFSPPDRLSARELVAYYAGLYDEARPVDDVLASVGVAEAADTRYANLSGGQRRRTLVGTAIVNDPDVLFLDEPTTGIDPAGRRTVWSLVEDLAGAGTTVFLTSHYMEEVERLADRIAVLAAGEIVATGTPAELVEAHGGENRLVVQTGDDVGADAESLADLAGFPAERFDDGLLVRDVEPEDVGAIVESLSAAGVTFDEITWRRPDLETVYLDLTGETPPDRAVAVGGDAR